MTLLTLNLSHLALAVNLSSHRFESRQQKVSLLSLFLDLQLQSLSVSLGLESQATRDGATLLTLNLSHLALAVNPSSRRDLLLAVSSLDCKRRKLSTPNSTKSTQKSR
ncbi:uncharacterized protein LOC126611757 [Malus sylvestris]|uniref:uncharacterized protein LOC126611757 n=1 Tax=Malus sylvestris TaxID=3752 RepID=UPI0021ACB987|nr:uncharacterized protein LOC126611757 [Malus sylvestris]